LVPRIWVCLTTTNNIPAFIIKNSNPYYFLIHHDLKKYSDIDTLIYKITHQYSLMKNLKIMAKPLNKINIKKKMYARIKILFLDTVWLHCYYCYRLIVLTPRLVINYILLHIKNIYVNVSIILAIKYHFIKNVIIIISVLAMNFFTPVAAMTGPDILSAAVIEPHVFVPAPVPVQVQGGPVSILALIHRNEDIDDMETFYTI
jgi:hypothetical protein